MVSANPNYLIFTKQYNDSNESNIICSQTEEIKNCNLHNVELRYCDFCVIRNCNFTDGLIFGQSTYLYIENCVGIDTIRVQDTCFTVRNCDGQKIICSNGKYDLAIDNCNFEAVKINMAESGDIIEVLNSNGNKLVVYGNFVIANVSSSHFDITYFENPYRHFYKI